jgi:hypothetical protein
MSNAYVLSMSEEDLTATVIELAHFHHWLVFHPRPARGRGGEWRTATQGDVGMPDLVLARGGVILLIELKTQRGRLSHEQTAWALAAGEHYRLIRPADLDALRKELA